MFKKKELSAEQIEAIETKNFFDRIVPGIIRFFTDYYICGNFYKSVWTITEYPPTTEETVISAVMSGPMWFLSEEITLRQRVTII